MYIALVLILVFLVPITLFITFVSGTIFSSAPWVPTSRLISRKMCEFGEIKKGDMVLDLGCGDASILIVAAREFGAKCVGVELNPMVAFMARVRVRVSGVQDSVTIVRGNMFNVELPDVDVVMMYLLPKATHRIEKRLIDRYAHLTVVSHGFQLAKNKVDQIKVGNATIRKYKW